MVTTAFQVNLNRLDIPNKRVAMDFLYREWLRAANPSRMLVFGTDMSPEDRIATTVLLWARSP
jgi:hypothetical protein